MSKKIISEKVKSKLAQCRTCGESMTFIYCSTVRPDCYSCEQELKELYEEETKRHGR